MADLIPAGSPVTNTITLATQNQTSITPQVLCVINVNHQITRATIVLTKIKSATTARGKGTFKRSASKNNMMIK